MLIHHGTVLGTHAIQEWPRHLSVRRCVRQLPLGRGNTRDATPDVERGAPDRLGSRSESLFLSCEHFDVRERVCEWGHCRLGSCGTRIVGGYV